MSRWNPALPQIRFFIVTGCTGLNLMLGMAALFYAAQDLMPVAAYCLLACVFLDACDGMLARRWEVSSPFGAQLDSLADFGSFSIASGVLAFHWFSAGSSQSLVAAASLFYVFTGAIRLARFNVEADPAAPPAPYFQGMPTTSVSAVVALAHLTCPQLHSGWGVALVFLLGILMVSVFPYPKLGKVLHLPQWLWILAALGAAFNLAWTIWLMAGGYILSGPMIWALRRYTAPPG